jgi:hypothetical protein
MTPDAVLEALVSQLPGWPARCWRQLAGLIEQHAGLMGGSPDLEAESRPPP